MHIDAILLAISSLATVITIGIAATRHSVRRYPAFVSYLSAILVSSLSSFIIETGFSHNQTSAWHYILPILFVVTSVTYYHFTRDFFNKSSGWGTYLAYAGIVVLAGIFNAGSILPAVHLFNNSLASYLTSLLIFILLGMAVRGSVQGFSKTADPYRRNVIVYLLAGVSVLILSTIASLILTQLRHSIPPTSNLLNALIISYAILRTNPLAANLMLRRTLAFLLAILCISAIFSTVIYFYYGLLPDQPAYGVVLLLSSCALLLALVTHPLRLNIEKWLEWLFYRRVSYYRETLLHFSGRLGNIITLDELADEILPILSKALLLIKVSLLIEDEAGSFSAQFTYPQDEEETDEKLRLSTGSPLVVRLMEGNTPLSLNQISNIPDLQEPDSSETEKINTDGLDTLYPIKSRGRLVGILALGRENPHTVLSYQDLQLIMVTTGQIGVLIENARLYSQALSWALSDGLTGLYNHRHFHISLEQEIARCARHNSILSLIMLDIDHFKTYNDRFGHPAGDKVLQKVSEAILSSIRTEDIACRYGGEEFVVILPETKIENAYTVAERIRTTIEDNLSSGEATVTASFGIASWPDDGTTKEDIIARADAALYMAKQTGRNRTCLSSDL